MYKIEDFKHVIDTCVPLIMEDTMKPHFLQSDKDTFVQYIKLFLYGYRMTLLFHFFFS